MHNKSGIKLMGSKSLLSQVTIQDLTNIQTGEYHSLVCPIDIKSTIVSQSTFQLDDYPLGDGYEPLDYATECGEPISKSKSELIACLITFDNISSGGDVTIIWYDTDGITELFRFKCNIPNPSEYGYVYWEWAQVYSWIGHFEHEINKPGDYKIKINTWLGDYERTYKIEQCPTPTTGYCDVSLDGSIAKGELVTLPGENQEITAYTLYVYNGERYIQKTVDDILGSTKKVVFTWDMIASGDCYFTILLTNSCGNMCEWIYSNILDYEESCIPDWHCEVDINGKNTGWKNDLNGCFEKTYDSIMCVPGEKLPEPSNLIFYTVISGLGLLGLKLLSKK